MPLRHLLLIYNDDDQELIEAKDLGTSSEDPCGSGAFLFVPKYLSIWRGRVRRNGEAANSTARVAGTERRP